MVWASVVGYMTQQFLMDKVAQGVALLLFAKYSSNR